MEAEKIDKLFKEKLFSAPSAPSAESWGKVEAMLGSNKKVIVGTFHYKWIAASIAIVLTCLSFLLIFEFDNMDNQIAQGQKTIESNSNDYGSENISLGDRSAPVETLPNEDNGIVDDDDRNDTEQQPQIAYATSVENRSANSANTTKNSMNNIAEKEDEDAGQKSDQMTTNNILENKEDGHEMIATEEMNQENELTVSKKKRRPIKIIYKKGNRNEAMIAQEEVVSDSLNTRKQILKSIIDVSRDIASGDLLADIRGAKSDFLNNGLESKNSRIKNSK